MAFVPTQHWQVEALKDLTETELSYQEIADKHRRSRSTILKLAKVAKVKRPEGVSNSRRRGKAIERDPLTAIHRMIGIRISLYPDREELKNILRISWERLRLMELGIHDYTLQELMQLQEVLDMSLAEILTPPKALKAIA